MNDFTMTRVEMIVKLGNIGRLLFAHDGTSFRALADYVKGCAQEFDLTADETKAIIYYIMQIK